MSDYISREAAIAFIREQSEEMGKAFEELGGESGIYADAYNDLAEDFYRVPAADVEPVRHGVWEEYVEHDEDWGDRRWNKCSLCGSQYSFGYVPLYCPNCGAKMDLEKKDNEQ